MSNPTKSLGYHLWTACQSRQRSLNRILKPYEITHAQYIVMQYLSRVDKEKIAELSQNKLAQELGLDPMMISNILKLLEKKGYITREKSGPGLQNIGLSLTGEGQDRIDQAVDAVDAFETEFFDTKDTKKLKKSLKKLVKNPQ